MGQKDKKKDKKKSEKRNAPFFVSDRNPLIERNRAKAIRNEARRSQKAGQSVAGQEQPRAIG